jgi:hypothetical protein
MRCLGADAAAFLGDELRAQGVGVLFYGAPRRRGAGKDSWRGQEKGKRELQFRAAR